MKEVEWREGREERTKEVDDLPQHQSSEGFYRGSIQ